MAKLEECRIYQSNAAMPIGWAFPLVLLLAKKFSQLGVALMVPLNKKGKQDGKRFQMDMQLLVTNYHLMRKREQDELCDKKAREALAE